MKISKFLKVLPLFALTLTACNSNDSSVVSSAEVEQTYQVLHEVFDDTTLEADTTYAFTINAHEKMSINRNIDNDNEKEDYTLSYQGDTKSVLTYDIKQDISKEELANFRNDYLTIIEKGNGYLQLEQNEKFQMSDKITDKDSLEVKESSFDYDATSNVTMKYDEENLFAKADLNYEDHLDTEKNKTGAFAGKISKEDLLAGVANKTFQEYLSYLEMVDDSLLTQSVRDYYLFTTLDLATMSQNEMKAFINENNIIAKEVDDKY
nr:hypothetical protein [Bacilli bacterium]